MPNAPKTARGLMSHVGALLAGVLSAFILVAALSYSDTPLIFLAYASGIPLFIAGLGAGALASLLAAYAGSASLMVVVPSNITVLYVFLFGLPAAAITTAALRHRMGNDGKTYWYPTGYLVALLPVYASVAFAAVAALVSQQESGLLGFTQQALMNVWNQPEQLARLKQAGVELDMNIVKAGVEQISFFMPSLCATGWITVMLASLMVAQRIVKAQGWNLRDKFDLENLRLPTWMIYVVAGTAIATTTTAAANHYYAYNLTLIFGLPYLLTGLAVVHAMARMTSAKPLILVIFYIALTLVPWIGALIILLGLADHWADFRKRWQSKLSNGIP